MFIAKHTLPSVDRASSLFKLYSVEASLSVLYNLYRKVQIERFKDKIGFQGKSGGQFVDNPVY